MRTCCAASKIGIDPPLTERSTDLVCFFTRRVSPSVGQKNLQDKQEELVASLAVVGKRLDALVEALQAGATVVPQVRTRAVT